MAAEYVTRWLEEKKPDANVVYLGPNEDDIHIWDMEFGGGEHTFRLGIVGSVADDEAFLAERLMELEAQGWLDDAGEKDLWVLVGDAEIGEGFKHLGEPRVGRVRGGRVRSTGDPS
jgi:hypothetical protein